MIAAAAAFIGFLACWWSKDWLIRAYDGDTNFLRRQRAKLDRLQHRLGL